MPIDSDDRSHAHRHRDSRSRSPDRSRRHRSRSRSRSPRRGDDRDRRRDDKDRDRDRSRRKDKDRERDREGRRSSRRDDSGSESDQVELPHGAEEIGEEDYFFKATELKLWLWEEKGKKLDSLKTEDARRYFKKFCRAWNKGRLSANYYAGIAPSSLPSSISTSHSWTFSKASQSDLDAAASIRKSIDTGSKTRSYSSAAGPAVGPSFPSSTAKGPQLGPAMPPSSAVERLQMERDALDSTRESTRAAYAAERKRGAREAREEERDSRSTGRDRLVEKRREGNASRREFEREREGGGDVEYDVDELMSGGTGRGGPAGSFGEAVKERERARERREERKFGREEERRAEMSDRLSAHRQKEDATMAMFKQMAQQRFGGGGGGA